MNKRFPVCIAGFEIQLREAFVVDDDDQIWVKSAVDNGVFSRSDNEFMVRIARENVPLESVTNGILIYSNLNAERLRQAFNMGLGYMLQQGMINEEDVTHAPDTTDPA